MNFQVIQMIGILFVALAVPLTLVAIGVRQFASEKAARANPETQGLRAALEQAAEKNWQLPEAISDGRGIFVLSSRETPLQIRAAIAKSVQELNGVVLSAPGGQNLEERLLVQLPASSAPEFENRLHQNFKQKQEGERAGDSRLYELVFSPP